MKKEKLKVTKITRITSFVVELFLIRTEQYGTVRMRYPMMRVTFARLPPGNNISLELFVERQSDDSDIGDSDGRWGY